MDEQERLRRLAEEVTANPGYLSGRRRFPRTVTADDAEAIVGGLHGAVDSGCQDRATAIARRGLRVACHAGCNACCEHPVMVYLPEAIRIARWLALPENATVKAQFLAAYPAWKAAMGDGTAELAELTASQRDRAALEAAHVALWKRRVMCAFNRDGACTIYAVRPMLCRDCHALGPPGAEAHCRADDDSGVPLQSFGFVPLQQVILKVRTVMIGLHNALGGTEMARRPQALPDAVAALLR